MDIIGIPELTGETDEKKINGTREDEAILDLTHSSPDRYIIINSYSDAVSHCMRILFPLFIDNIIFYASGFADGVIVGRLGTRVLASSSLIGRIKDFATVPPLSIFYILQPLIASSIQSDNDARRNVSHLFWASLVISAASSTLIIPALLTVHYLISMVDQEHANDVKQYFQHYVISIYAQFLTAIINNLLLSTGKSFALVPFSILRTLLEVSLSIFMIYKLELGIVGWGIASGAQPWISLMIASLSLLLADVRRYFNSYGIFDVPGINSNLYEKLKQILKFGLPITLQVALLIGNSLVSSLFVSKLGNVELASYQIASSVALWSIMALDPIATVLSVILPSIVDGASRNRLMNVVCSLAALGSIFFVLISTLAYKSIVNMYSSSNSPDYNNILSTCRMLIPILSLTAPIYGAKSVMVGMMRSEKKTTLPLISEAIGITFNIVFSLIVVLQSRDLNILAGVQMASLSLGTLVLFANNFISENSVSNNRVHNQASSHFANCFTCFFGRTNNLSLSYFEEEIHDNDALEENISIYQSTAM